MTVACSVSREHGNEPVWANPRDTRHDVIVTLKLNANRSSRDWRSLVVDPIAIAIVDTALAFHVLLHQM
jgi:hypothetical protein